VEAALLEQSTGGIAMTSMINPAYTLPMGVMGPVVNPYAAAYGGMQVVPYSSMSQLPPGAIPVSQSMLAQALGQGQAGALGVQSGTEDAASPIKSLIKGAAVGAAAGAAFGIIPFLPLRLVSGAIVGAAVGGTLGLVKGIKAKQAEKTFHTMEAQQAAAQAAMNAATPAGARNVAPTTVLPAQANAVASKGVVMGPAMRRKWAAKVAAEKAAAAKAATH
jgi:hypothetical protein